MPGITETDEARATAKEIDGALEVSLGGTWQITAPRPAWSKLVNGRKPARVRATIDDVEKWDTSLLLFLFEAQEWCRTSGAQWDADGLPEKIRTLLTQFVSAHEACDPRDRSDNFLMSVGHATLDTWQRARTASTFLGESVIGVMRLLKRPRRFR
jgi:phospholipid/cholesterol/gamma-HCH transport system permease protein